MYVIDTMCYKHILFTCMINKRCEKHSPPIRVLYTLVDRLNRVSSIVTRVPTLRVNIYRAHPVLYFICLIYCNTPYDKM